MMKIRSTGKIVLSCFLSLCLLLSLVTAASLTSFAKGDEATAVTVVDVTGLTDAQKDGAHWVLESAPADKGGVNTDSFRIKHVASGKYFAVDADKNMVLSAYDANDQKQVWQVTDWYGYYWCLMNVAANGWLTLDANTKDLSLVSGDGINLIDTPYPLLIMSATAMGYKNGLFIFLFRQFFRNIPHELDEAAAIDGCGPFKTFFHIMLPTAGTMITTVFLLSFSWQWTDTYYNGLFFKGFSVLPTVINLAQMGETQIMGANMVNVAAILAILPLAVLYIFAQKFFVESIENSGLVG